MRSLLASLTPILLCATSPEVLADPVPDTCVSARGVAAWVSPEVPALGQPVRVVFVSETDISGQVDWRGPGEGMVTTTKKDLGGPPWSVAVMAQPREAGRHQVAIRKDGKTVSCHSFRVRARVDRADRRKQGPQYWASESDWNADFENLYSAWVEALFDAPLHEELTFRPLEQALRDRERNLLYDHLGLGEDDPRNRNALPATPDCADLPYFLRAYFAWKLQLPFGYRDCDRGTRTRAPRCGQLQTNEAAGIVAKGKNDPLAAFREFSRLLRNAVHSGGLRTGLDDDNTDFYPVAVQRNALRPGVVYADPYGHVLIISKWLAQKPGHPGLLLAVDGQPDTSITRKRFWEGNFLFASDIASAGAGWKAFRPFLPPSKSPTPSPSPSGPAASPSEGLREDLQQLGNADLKDRHQHRPYSNAQASLSSEAFHLAMGKLINPKGMNALTAYDEMLDALVEQLEARVRSVQNGETHMVETKDSVVEMPEGADIFETVGPWEDYATPSRDMRLLIAINVLNGLPARITAHPDLYDLGGQTPREVQQAVTVRHAEQVAKRFIEYVRTDGQTQRLAVADVLARRTALEMAYNPNDCVEVRWGAKPGSDEHASCRRHAPEAQQKKMSEYRGWFATARRPPRD